MKTVKAFICGISAISIGAGAAFAQPAPADPRKDALFNSADANRDGVIDRAEFAAAVNLPPLDSASGGASASAAPAAPLPAVPYQWDPGTQN